MNLALWKKTFRESRWLLAAAMAFMFAVHWLRVWIASFFSSQAMEGLLSFLPVEVQGLMPVSYSQMATTAGRIAIAYDDPIVLLLVTVWAISRGSDAVSGELNRGTMEMVLAQPVSRLGVLTSQAAVTVLGSALLALTALLGTRVGLATVNIEQPAPIHVFYPAALNLFAITVFLAGLSTMVSSGSSYRARTIGIVGGIYAVSMLMKVVGRMATGWEWLTNFSFFTPFEPQMLVGDTTRAWAWSTVGPDEVWMLGGLGYASILIGLGLVFYGIAIAVFCHRDLPAPL